MALAVGGDAKPRSMLPNRCHPDAPGAAERFQYAPRNVYHQAAAPALIFQVETRWDGRTETICGRDEQ